MSLCLRFAVAGLLLIATTLSARAQSLLSSGSLPPLAEEADASRIAMQALTRGQTSVTLVLATEPVDGLQERVNRIHFRMNQLGWRLSGQEFVSGVPQNSVLLLSYQR